LIEKSENDDKFIQALKKEVQKLQKKVEYLEAKAPEIITRVVYKPNEEVGDRQ